MKKYVIVLHTKDGYLFIGKLHGYIPVLSSAKSKFGSLKNYARKHGYSVKKCAERQEWVKQYGGKVVEVDVA